MTRNAIIVLGFGLAVASHVLGPAAALADPAYRKDDIIKHFVRPAPEMGKTRGICIGTEADCPGTPKAVALAPQAKEAFDLVVTFGLNSDNLTDDAKANLVEFAKALKDPLLSSASFMVEGHTDGRGSEDYNLGLSERRAAAVVLFLREQGVPTDKLKPRGYGKAKPRVADIMDPTNRRVETRLRTE